MMGKKSKKPSWFKLWLHHRSLFDAVPDDVAGRAVKAALNYFATGEVVPMGQLESVVFSAIKADIDDAFADYMRDVENGKKGGRPKLTDEKPPVKVGNPPKPMEREGERDGDGEGEREEEGKGGKAEKPPSRHRFAPPTVDEVRQYCQDHGYCVDAERFVNHYTAQGWKVGRNPMKDWKAAVRNWNRSDRKENSNGTNGLPGWTVGTVL